MPESFFSYNITRPYPYRWFTPVVIVGAIISVVLVSFLNVAATGYELHAISSDNFESPGQPNWFDTWPSWIVSARSSCQPATFPLLSRVYTNNTAIPYKLQKVTQIDSNGQKTVIGSLSYSGQTLQQCNVSRLTIDIDVNNRGGGQVALFAVGGTVTTMVDCALGENIFFTLNGVYEPSQGAGDEGSDVPGRNKTTKASLYWGESLMRPYWAHVLQEFYRANYYAPHYYFNGVIHLLRNSTEPTATIEEASSEDFFKPWCAFNRYNESGIFHPTDYCWESVSGLKNGSLMPDIWEPVNILGKATYFTILADLGHNDAAMPNILADPTVLADLTSNLTTVHQSLNPPEGPNFSWGIPELAKEPYDPTKDNNHLLGVSPAVLATNYMCQVPKLKTPGSLIVSVLVADLVILQTIWTIYKLFVDGILVGKKAELRSCGSCTQDSDGLSEPILSKMPSGAYSEIREVEENPKQRISSETVDIS